MDEPSICRIVCYQPSNFEPIVPAIIVGLVDLENVNLQVFRNDENGPGSFFVGNVPFLTWKDFAGQCCFFPPRK